MIHCTWRIVSFYLIYCTLRIVIPAWHFIVSESLFILWYIFLKESLYRLWYFVIYGSLFTNWYITPYWIVKVFCYILRIGIVIPVLIHFLLVSRYSQIDTLPPIESLLGLDTSDHNESLFCFDIFSCCDSLPLYDVYVFSD